MTSPRHVIRGGARLARRGWRRLTSMRTALILLFLLAVAAVPGSILPQRPLNPSKTTAYIAAHGRWGQLLDRLGMFDVFGSVWFAAIYLLLGISLVGCLIPRIRVHARALRTPPLPAPQRLHRLPESATFHTSDPADRAATQLRAALGRRWRTRARSEPDGTLTISAEKGYLRETGNLIFHVALLIAVVAIAVDRLYAYEGSIIVQQGHGFCNTAVDLDSLRTGRLASGRSLAPFCVDDLNKFTATYTAVGEPTGFAAEITYVHGTNGSPQRATVKVNEPLRIEGVRLYLTGHGFAPTFTVRMPDGSTRASTTTFLPQDATLTSEGVVKLQGRGSGSDFAIQGVFAPDAITTSTGVLTSGSPAPINPAVAVFFYQGNLGLDSGAPQNVYSLDARQIQTGALRHVGTATLTPGQSTSLPGGVRVTFDGYTQWVNFQISHNPGQNYLLLAAVAMLAGLVCSLSIRRRRLWIRLTPDGHADSGSGSCIEVGGLARSDSGNFTAEFSAILTRLRGCVAPTPAHELSREGAH